ncbi:hypothetical protein DICVIV_02309 [Dictyocaulus viviparus]|uniref:Uncharacterized protein n=1 Tax=Dictyocaulus viviparus TaxID=29172 RepID=A0A0D8YA73_DICVI|nr:hypothetical protein DICVIV_02309 [Dictyocaulus viviparus]
MYNTSLYVFYMCLPPYLFAFIAVFLFYLFMNDDPINSCSPVQAVPRVMGFVSYIINALNIASLILIVAVIVTVGNSRKGEYDWKKFIENVT